MMARAEMEREETNTTTSPDNTKAKKQNIGQVITEMLTEPVIEHDALPGKEPVPPELVSDAVGWAPSMPPGPLLLDLAAHDPHQTKVPLSEAKTIPPKAPAPVLVPPANLVPEVEPKRKVKPIVAIISAGLIGAVGTTVVLLALFFWFGQ